ncbi:MAG: gliding motility-associated C-terminal domain-containing protein [Crocinitomicaceae bacterium]|nr:gliding motility-associated C-terminal domain-containing protein [Flavobacteriales bacterium]NQZ38466.1 gliding motility-associated C-terminal domain-containing protein [Crocinitomicaceae bacterium]
MTRLLFIFFILLSCKNSYSQNSNCLTFDGNNQLIYSSNQALNNISTGDFTFEAWINGTVNPNSQHPAIFSNRNSTTEGTTFFFHSYWGGSASKMLCVQLFGMNYLVVNNGTYGAEILDGACHHVAVTKTASTITFYVDGIPFGTRVVSGTPSTSSPQTLWIGKDHIINSTFDGSISTLKIWNVALSQEDLNKSINCDSTLFYSPAAFWKLNEGTGQLVLESASNTYDNLGSNQSIENQDPIWNGQCCIQDTIDCDQYIYSVELTLPNIITVNMDNINDVFTPVAIDGINKMHTTILNRWGNIMYSTDDLLINWAPSNISEGVYYYIINYTSFSGSPKTVNGFFHVIY